MPPTADRLGSDDDPQRREATNFFMEARLALKNNETARAEKLLSRALSLWPDNYNYTLQMAKLAIQVGKKDYEIEQLLQRSSSLNLTATEPRLLLATQYEKVGDQARAVAIYKSVLNIDPGNLIVRRRFGQLNIDLSLGMSMSSFVGRFGAEASADNHDLGEVDEDKTPPVEEAEPEQEATPPSLPALTPPEPAFASVYTEEPGYSGEPLYNDRSTEPLAEQEESATAGPPDDMFIETQVFGSISANPENAIPESEYGWDSFVEAIQHDSQMMEIDGTMRLNVGISYIDLGLHDAAVEELEEAYVLFIRKGDEEALRCCRLLVDCTLAMGQYQKAAEWCERALELGGRDNEAGFAYLDELAGIYKRLGYHERSDALYSELNFLSPGYHDVPSVGTQLEMEAQIGETVVEGRFALRPIQGISGDDFIFGEGQVDIAIGRSNNNDMIIDSLRVSKEHARLRFTHNKGNFIISLSKTNGTYLNEQRLEIGREYPLVVGDRIGLGKTIELQLIDRYNY